MRKIIKGKLWKYCYRNAADSRRRFARPRKLSFLIIFNASRLERLCSSMEKNFLLSLAPFRDMPWISYAIQQSAFIGFSFHTIFRLLFCCFIIFYYSWKLQENENWALTQKFNLLENFNLLLAIFFVLPLPAMKLRMCTGKCVAESVSLLFVLSFFKASTLILELNDSSYGIFIFD